MFSIYLITELFRLALHFSWVITVWSLQRSGSFLQIYGLSEHKVTYSILLLLIWWFWIGSDKHFFISDMVICVFSIYVF